MVRFRTWFSIIQVCMLNLPGICNYPSVTQSSPSSESHHVFLRPSLTDAGGGLIQSVLLFCHSCVCRQLSPQPPATNPQTHHDAAFPKPMPHQDTCWSSLALRLLWHPKVDGWDQYCASILIRGSEVPIQAGRVLQLGIFPARSQSPR